MRVFIADDNRPGLEEFQTFFELRGCQVTTAQTLEEAHTLVENQNVAFDVAILDMVFQKSKRGGFELLKQMKKRRPALQSIIVTAFGTPEMTSLCAAEGAFTYDRSTKLETLYRLVEQAYFYKEGIAFAAGPKVSTMWALGMPCGRDELRNLIAPLPRYRRDEVVARTMFLGVCGTDLHTFSAGGSSSRNYPIVEFHEAVGVVLARSRDVDDPRFEIGDWVIPMVRRCQRWNREPQAEWDFHIGICPHREDCRSWGRPDCCPRRPGYLSRGTGKCHGFGSEYFSDSQDWLVRVPVDTRKHLGPLCVLTEPLSVSWKVIREVEARRGVDKMRDRVLVVGIGPIGMFCTAIITRLYPGVSVVAVDLFDSHHKVSVLNEHFGERVQYEKVERGGTWPGSVTKEPYDIIIDASGDITDVFPKMCSVIKPEGVIALLSVSGRERRGESLVLEIELFDYIVTSGVKIIGSVCASRSLSENYLEQLRVLTEIWDWVTGGSLIG